MKIEVKFFAICREITGCDARMIELPEGATGEVFWQHITAIYPGLGAFKGTGRLAVNMAYVANNTVLQPGDEVCIIPPVSGG